MSENFDRTILLAAGGTGGHLFPAYALAEELSSRSWRVDLATDTRGDRYGTGFPATEIHQISSATLRGRSPIAFAKTGISLADGVRQAYSLLGRLKPAVVVGFGGYPCFPPLVAAKLRGIPTALHEQNAVLGRANRMLASRVSAIATSFPEVKFLEGAALKKATFTGNPVRDSVVEQSATPYPAAAAFSAHQPLQLLIVGGSQGARFFSERIPPVLAAMDADTRARISVVQQCREEDLEQVRSVYANADMAADCQTFFTDLPRIIASSHLVIGRAGASTVAELTVIGRPSLLVPLPTSLDNDQFENAKNLATAGGAVSIAQAELTHDRLQSDLINLLQNPGLLQQAAADAKSVGQPNAVAKLADLVEELVAV